MTKQEKIKVSATVAVDLADEVTILVCAADHSASKKWIRNAEGAIEKIGYDAGTYFGVMPKPVSDIRTLSALLLALERMPNTLVIRGAPAEGLADVGVRRTKDTFITPEAGRRWILIDFDKIPLPDGLALQDDARAAIEYLVGLLPEEFHDCSYHYQLSSSAGLGDPRKASAHLWFWLTEPWTDQALKSWAKSVNKRAGYKLVDAALFNDVQAHYTAAPIFVDVDNPFPVRSALVEKAHTAVSIQTIEAPAELFPPAAGEFEPGPDFEGWLARIGDHPGGEGFHGPIISATASYVSEHGREGTDVEELFQAVSMRVLEADRSHHDDAPVEHAASREEIMRAIEGALAKFGDRPASRRPSRLVPNVAPPEPRASLSPEEAQRRLSATFKRLLGTTKA